MTRPGLADRIVGYLAEHGQARALEIARALEVRATDVTDVLRADERFSEPLPGERGRLYYQLRSVVPRGSQRAGGRSQCERVLAVLADGGWHDHHEFYGWCVLHSRISDLRAQGHEIEMRREGSLYLYRLAGQRTRDADEAVGMDVFGAPLEAAGSPGIGRSPTWSDREPAASSGTQLTFGEAA